VTEPNPDPVIALLLDSMIETEEPPKTESLPELLAAVLAATTEPGTSPGNDRAFRGFVRRFAAMFDLSTAAAEAILRRASSPISRDWQKMKSMHVFHFSPGNALRGAHAGLVRVAPGTTFPSHTTSAPRRRCSSRERRAMTSRARCTCPAMSLRSGRSRCTTPPCCRRTSASSPCSSRAGRSTSTTTDLATTSATTSATAATTPPATTTSSRDAGDARAPLLASISRLTWRLSIGDNTSLLSD